MKKFIIVFVLALFAISLVGAVQVGSSSAAASSSAASQPVRVTGPLLGSYSCSSSKPCPMGLVDYGVNGKTKYSYTAIELKSWVNFTTLSIGTATKGAPSHHMDVQQNSVDYSVYENGKTGEYWIQDIPQIAQSGSSYKVTAEDNIWNFSTATAYLKGTIYENLLGDCSPYGKGSGGEFYYCYAKQSFTTTLPFEVEMIVLTGVDTTFTGHKGASAVEFEFGVYHDGTLLGFKAYDWVDFNTNNAPAGPLIHVGGFNPFSYNDFETLVAGPNGGSNIQFISIGATFSAFYAPSSYGTFIAVPHAWSAGSDTAETASGVHMTGSGHTGIASSGADNNNQLF